MRTREQVQMQEPPSRLNATSNDIEAALSRLLVEDFSELPPLPPPARFGFIHTHDQATESETETTPRSKHPRLKSQSRLTTAATRPRLKRQNATLCMDDLVDLDDERLNLPSQCLFPHSRTFRRAGSGELPLFHGGHSDGSQESVEADPEQREIPDEGFQLQERRQFFRALRRFRAPY